MITDPSTVAAINDTGLAILIACLFCAIAPLLGAIVQYMFAAPDTYRRRPDGHANEWAARRARRNRRG